MLHRRSNQLAIWAHGSFRHTDRTSVHDASHDASRNLLSSLDRDESSLYDKIGSAYSLVLISVLSVAVWAKCLIKECHHLSLRSTLCSYRGHYLPQHCFAATGRFHSITKDGALMFQRFYRTSTPTASALQMQNHIVAPISWVWQCCVSSLLLCSEEQMAVSERRQSPLNERGMLQRRRPSWRAWLHDL